MIGEIVACILLAAIVAMWIAAMKSVITDRYIGALARIFLSVLFTVIGAAVFMMAYAFIPTTTTYSEIAPGEYKHVKNEKSAVYLYKDAFKHTEDAYLYKNAGDSTKVEVIEVSWKNIRGTLIGTTIQVNEKK